MPSIANNDLSIFHLNIQSLNRVGDHLAAYLETLKVKFDIICLTKTRLSEGKCYDHLFPHFTPFHSYHKLQTEGGTAIYVGNHLESREPLDNICKFDYLELITFEINIKIPLLSYPHVDDLRTKHYILSSLSFVKNSLG